MNTLPTQGAGIPRAERRFGLDDDFDFGGPADSGCWMSHDDSDDFAAQCSDCGEPCHPSKMSRDTPDVCHFCCPVRRAVFEAELAADCGPDDETQEVVIDPVKGPAEEGEYDDDRR